MDLLHLDFKKGTAKLRITDLDDLWYLSRIIEPGDLLTGTATRKVKIGASENAAQTKKVMTVTIRAETIEFGSAGDSLRINGKIKAAPEDVPQESYQAIALEEGSEFILQKEHWQEYQKQKLQEAAEKKYNYLLLIFDREEAILALTKKRGFEILLKTTGEAQKKDRTIDVRKDFQQELVSLLEYYHERLHPERIVVASPAFYKEDLMKKVSPELQQKIVLATCSDVSERALDEVIKQPALATILVTSRIREEQLLMDQLLAEINRNNLAMYGWEEVEKAAAQGAIAALLLTDDFIETRQHAGSFDALDSLMRQVDGQKAKVHILAGENEPGRKLNGLGGIAALLRYKTWT